MTTASLPLATPLAIKLVAVAGAVDRIAKSGHNDAQNYDFVTDADVLDALRKALSAQGVATLTSVTSIETVPFTTSSGKPQFLVTVKGEIAFISGAESYTVYGVGQGADSGDKGVYKAITGMVKYALLKTFLVPTGDDSERDDVAPKAAAQSTGAKPTTTAEKASGTLSDKQRALLMARFREVGLEGGQRVDFTSKVVGKFSSKQLDSDDLDKLLIALKDEALVAASKAEVLPA